MSSSIPVFVGLDYHQDSVQVCVMDQQGKVLVNRSCANDWQALRDAVERVGVVQRAGIARPAAEQRRWPSNWSSGRGGTARWDTRGTSRR